MTTPQSGIDAHVRLTMAGEFRGAGAASEIWQWGLKFGSIGDAPGNNTAEWQADASTIKDAWLARIAPHHGAHVVLTNVKISAHVAGGKTALNSQGGYDQGEWVGQAVPTPLGGLGSGNVFPLQTSCVVSLQTPRAGARGKGRVFLPQLQFGLSNYVWPTDRVAAVATAFRDFLVDIRPALGQARVFSTLGGNSPVVSVRVGTVPDTQRSRRSALLEAYSSATLPAFP